MLELRIPACFYGQMREQFNRPARREAVVFALVSQARAGDRDLILVRDLITPPESAFLPSSGHGARWRGAYMIELLNAAVERGLGLFVFHAHPVDRPQLSRDDRNSAIALLPKFQVVQPRRPHGSVVFGRHSAAGIVLLPGRDHLDEQFRVRLFEGRIVTWPMPEVELADDLLFEKQPLTDGHLSARVLQQTKVAVVGLSGGGSQVVLQLAGLGVGQIVGVDNQRFDGSNRFASDAVTWLDAVLHRKKTSAMRGKVRTANRHVRFIGIRQAVPGRDATEAVKQADIIVGCVNNLHARADLMEIAWRYCIPYVDIGLGVHPEEGDGAKPRRIVSIAGNVSTAVPGGPCMWCSGFLSNEKLSKETGGKGRAYMRQLADDGQPEPNVRVLSFNRVLAGLAVSDVLQLLLGFSPVGLKPYRRYDAFEGTVAEWGVTRKPDCPLCSAVLAAGDPLWAR
jgi:hypothetical protein